ncbi:SusC/RagA family TonB-linked outer membrane protein [Maribacter luteus]|uniref:SusC/RagA family TonB-linked outer membrane protein n=1 Tax=Maribacter luteus TaxID=2594478 RepID=UPI00248FE019|nr:SusC/RagA family TonB-linked outer membrane protein [Maribacter luteus]
MKKIKQCLLLAVFMIPIGIFAQTTVTGNVTDQATGGPLPGVSIVVVGTSTGTTTDFDGYYTLTVDDDAVLQFSYIGYKTLDIPVTGPNLDIVMEEDRAQLDEVVVIGYGSVKKEDLTGSADMITSKDFNQGPMVSAQQLITGKIAGVSVTSGGGAPGEGQNIIIRGLGSLSLTSSPLIVVDGIPLNDGGVGGSRNPLNLLNPNDIENMVVLKDASATAIYGSRAANGVIMITTKKGKDRDMSYSVTSALSVYSPINKVDVLSSSQFRSLINSTNDADAISRLGTSNTDWQDEIYSPAVGSDVTASALGSAWGVPMRASIGYTDQGGILKNDNFTRMTGSLNLTPQFLDDHLKLELNARGMYTENFFANQSAIGSAVDFDPTQPIFNGSKYGGYFSWIDENTGSQMNLAPTNPVALLDLVEDTAEVRRIIGNAKLDYKLHFFPDLTATVNAGLDISNSHGRKITSEFIPTSDPTWNGSRTTYTNEATNRLFDAYLTYNKDFNDTHSLNVVAGYSYQEFEFDDYSYDSELEEDNFNNPDSDITYEFIDKSKNVLLSYFGRANYNYKSKYLLTATLRADASSKLNPDDRWGYFPSFAFAWNVHKESFMERFSVFDELKLRLGYGEVGNVNGLGDYLFLTNYTGSTSTAEYQFGNSFYQTFRPEPVNENLKWEVGKTFNIGLDYSLFSRRIYGSFNAYKKETTDLIASTFVDPFTNFGNRIDANIGDMENKGLEAELNIVPIRTDNMTWTISYNIAFNDNEVTNLPDQQYVGGIDGGTGNTIQTHVEGEAPYSFLVYQQVYDIDGKPIEGAFVDRNGDNVINESDKFIYKDPYADVFMGLNSNLTYKNWDLNIVTRANFGNYAYNNVASSKAYLTRATQNNILTNLHSDYLDTGFSEITDGNLQSNLYVQDASFFKIDNITLGYSWPKAYKDVNIRLYGSVQNVATFTDYDGIDPEITGGIDNNLYPRPRTVVLGLNFDF